MSLRTAMEIGYPILTSYCATAQHPYIEAFSQQFLKQ